jgi:hypothetical protein
MRVGEEKTWNKANRTEDTSKDIIWLYLVDKPFKIIPLNINSSNIGAATIAPSNKYTSELNKSAVLRLEKNSMKMSSNPKR